MGINSLVEDAVGLAKANPVATALGTAGIATGAVLGTAAIVGATKSRKSKRSKSNRSRKRSRRIKHTKRGLKQDRKRFNKSQKWEVAYRKRKRKHHKSSGKRRGKIYYAKKTGQPYILLRNGRAKFIKGRRKK